MFYNWLDIKPNISQKKEKTLHILKMRVVKNKGRGLLERTGLSKINYPHNIEIIPDPNAKLHWRYNDKI